MQRAPDGICDKEGNGQMTQGTAMPCVSRSTALVKDSCRIAQVHLTSQVVKKEGSPALCGLSPSINLTYDRSSLEQILQSWNRLNKRKFTVNFLSLKRA